MFEKKKSKLTVDDVHDELVSLVSNLQGQIIDKDVRVPGVSSIELNDETGKFEFPPARFNVGKVVWKLLELLEVRIDPTSESETEFVLKPYGNSPLLKPDISQKENIEGC